jgi:uncharacterized protein (DUF2252 family)
VERGIVHQVVDDVKTPELWSAVVQLVASHESAYLEHCRQYALDAARRR